MNRLKHHLDYTNQYTAQASIQPLDKTREGLVFDNHIVFVARVHRAPPPASLWSHHTNSPNTHTYTDRYTLMGLRPLSGCNSYSRKYEPLSVLLSSDYHSPPGCDPPNQTANQRQSTINVEIMVMPNNSNDIQQAEQQDSGIRWSSRRGRRS